MTHGHLYGWTIIIYYNIDTGKYHESVYTSAAGTSVNTAIRRVIFPCIHVVIYLSEPTEHAQCQQQHNTYRLHTKAEVA